MIKDIISLNNCYLIYCLTKGDLLAKRMEVNEELWRIVYIGITRLLFLCRMWQTISLMENSTIIRTVMLAALNAAMLLVHPVTMQQVLLMKID